MTKGNILIVTFPPFEPQTEEHALKRLRDEGYDLYLLGNGLAKPTEGLFTKHFAVDITSFNCAISALPSDLTFQAVTGEFIDRFSPLVAALCQRYNVIGNSLQVAYNCRNKFRMRKLLRDAGVSKVRSFLCKSFEEIEEAAQIINGPCVAKPLGGDSSVGVFFIKSPEMLPKVRTFYEDSQRYIQRIRDQEFYFSHSPEELKLLGEEDLEIDLLTHYVVEEYIEGQSLSVDSLVQDGVVHPMGIAEQIRMKPPFFVQIAERMPFSAPQKHIDEILRVNEGAIRALHIENSPTHIEMRISNNGVEIIEAACRFGGDNIHDSVLQTTGHSLFYEGVKISLGEKLSIDSTPKCFVSMQYLLPKRAGIFKRAIIPPEVIHHPSVTEHCITADEGDLVGPPPKSFDFMGYIQVRGKTADEADRILAQLSEKIVFELDPVAPTS